MPQSSSNFDLLVELLRDSIHRNEAFEERICTELRSMRDDMKDLASSSHVKEIETKVDTHSETLIKHGHNFSILSWCVTGGAATVVGLFTWISGAVNTIFPHK